MALGLVAERVAGGLGDIGRDRSLVTYCTGPHCDSSHRLARRLSEEHGFTQVRVMRDGWRGWVEAGYPVERGESDE